jgi:ATP-dependent Clp protease protease subunit
MLNLPPPKERNLFFSDQVNQYSVSQLSKDIVDINESDRYIKKIYAAINCKYEPEPIKIYIDSYGGSVYQILGLVGIIEKSDTPINTIVTGTAMSAGFILAICGHKRYAYDYSTFMVHQLSSENWGKLEDLKDNMSENERLQGILDNIILQKTKIKPPKLKKIYKRKKDWFIDSNNAIKLGIIDIII